jgi:hypothetical protein
MTLQSAFQRSLSILKSLVEIESVNPTLVPGGAGELRIAEYRLSVLQAEGIACSLEVCLAAATSWSRSWKSDGVFC